MKKMLVLCALVAAVAAPAAAQPTGSAALQYYVGNWACTGGPLNQPAVNATATYTMQHGVLSDTGLILPQGKMKTAYAFSGAESYDAAKHRYVSTFLDNGAGWELSVAKPWTGTTEEWTDVSTDSGKLGRTQYTRTDANNFTINGYETKTSAKPNFKVTCKRSS